MALLRLFIEVLVDLCSLRPGVLPQKTPQQKTRALCFASFRRCHQFTTYVGGAYNPYLLISLLGKRHPRDVGGFETDPSSNKPVRAKLRRLKSHSSPLRSLLLATNPRLRKE
jgi:hypothetical protein